MAHHLMQTQDIQQQCPYCKGDIGDNFRSEFHNNTHYKTVFCKCCGHKNTLTVNFDGSGHDDWAGHERWRQELERAVKKHTVSRKDDALKDLVDEEYRYLEHPVDDLADIPPTEIEELEEPIL